MRYSVQDRLQVGVQVPDAVGNKEDSDEEDDHQPQDNVEDSREVSIIVDFQVQG